MPGTEPAVFGLVGNTPLVELPRLDPARGRVRLFAKLESRNPGGSVKDRAARAMIRDGLRTGAFAPGKTLVDATSGNTGIAYAMLCASLGRPCTLYMPANVSDERKRVMAGYGARLVFTDPLEGQDGAIDAVRALVKADPAPWFYPDQYSNPANPEAHAETTAPEIWQATGGAVTHLVAGLGTTGTAMGTTRGLRARRPDLVSVGVEPQTSFHGIEGLKHLATSHVPGIFRAEELDRRVAVASEDAFAAARRLAREEGVFAGTSSGAALHAALDVAREAPDGSLVVVILPDGGDRYLSGGLWPLP